MTYWNTQQHFWLLNIKYYKEIYGIYKREHSTMTNSWQGMNRPVNSTVNIHVCSFINIFPHHKHQNLINFKFTDTLYIFVITFFMVLWNLKQNYPFLSKAFSFKIEQFFWRTFKLLDTWMKTYYCIFFSVIDELNSLIRVPLILLQDLEHNEFLKRIRKSLYYSKLPKINCLSLPVTG